MSEHYYTKSPNSQSNPSQAQFDFLGTSLHFRTDHGVFSKGSLDKGTEILLKHLPPLSGSLLDLGCGWGAIGIALSKKYPALQVTMVDINERAVTLASQNAKTNQVSPRILQGDGFSPLASQERFDTIVTNPPIRAGKKIIYSWFNQSIQHLNPQGQLFLVIRKQQGAPSALSHLKNLFSDVAVIKKEGGYWIIACKI